MAQYEYIQSYVHHSKCVSNATACSCLINELSAGDIYLPTRPICGLSFPLIFTAFNMDDDSDSWQTQPSQPVASLRLPRAKMHRGTAAISNLFGMSIPAGEVSTMLMKTAGPGGVVSGDLVGDWIPQTIPMPNPWLISSLDVPLQGGFISMFCPYDKNAQPLPPVYIVNPSYPESNQLLYLRTALPTGQLPYYWLYHRISAVPKALKDVFRMEEAQIWMTYDAIPPPLEGPQIISCPANRLPPSRIPFHSTPVPTFQYQNFATPSSRIRQNSRLQLICPSKDESTVGADCTALLRVKGSRGFTRGSAYEILELDFEHLDHSNPAKYVWLHVPPPFVHDDVCMVVEPFSENAVEHESHMGNWKRALVKAEPGYVETAGDKDKRAWAVWSLMYWYLISRRLQCV